MLSLPKHLYLYCFVGFSIAFLRSFRPRSAATTRQALKYFNHTLLAAAFNICVSACGTDKPTNTAASTIVVQSITQDTAGTSIDSALTSFNSTKVTGQAAKHLLRVNDTLELEFSHPLGVFITDEQPVPQTVWKQIALRGRRGWYQVVDENSQWSAYHAAVAPTGDLVQIPTVGINQEFVGSQGQLKKPVTLAEDDFYYNTYDVPYRTWTQYVAEDFNPLPVRQVDSDFLGGEASDGNDYYPLPHWLTQEKARLARTKSLPAPERLTAFISLSKDTAAGIGTLSKPYRPLLVQLLRLYKAYPMPADTVGRLNRVLQSLELSTGGKGR